MPFRHGFGIGDRGSGERVPGEYVHAAAHDDGHDGRGGREVVQDPAQLRLGLLRGAAARPGRLLAGEPEEVAVLVFVQVEGLGHPFEYGGGGGQAHGAGVGSDRRVLRNSPSSFRCGDGLISPVAQ